MGGGGGVGGSGYKTVSRGASEVLPLRKGYGGGEDGVSFGHSEEGHTTLC